jgi:hypothetical protein
VIKAGARRARVAWQSLVAVVTIFVWLLTVGGAIGGVVELWTTVGQ